MAATARQTKGRQIQGDEETTAIAAKTGRSAKPSTSRQARAPKSESTTNASNATPTTANEQHTDQQQPQRGANAEARQEKVVKDTFSFPPDDYALIARLQDAMLDERMVVNKGEVLRAGLHALLRLSGEGRKAIFKDLKKLKAGRRSERNPG